MKISVDLRICQNYGQCTYAAPQVFALDDKSMQAFRAHASEIYVSDELPEQWLGNVEEAVDMCPVRAIQIVSD